MMPTKPLIFVLPQSPPAVHDHVDFMPKSSCKPCVRHKFNWVFTLIERLVVIAIAILPSKLLAAFSRSKFKTTMINFASNSSQWTQMTNMNASDDPQRQIVGCPIQLSPQQVLAAYENV
jgi:hypothetical protein